MIKDKIAELERWHLQHDLALETTRGRQLAIMVAEMDNKLQLKPTFHAAAVAVMKNAGQGQVISQCELMEGELNGLLTQRRACIKSCLETLQTYAAMITTFPKCKALMQTFHSRYSQADENKVTHILRVETKLHELMLEANKKMVRAAEKAAATDNIDVSKVEEAQTAVIIRINTFLQENGDAGVHSLRAVVMNALCSFNRRSLIMEGAVAGEFLSIQ
ncbi:serine/threonine-protein kinase SMG1-like isoform X2 [Anneissia japonica]|uniref:serine/threonine-protein kinase SMG1-like isoform X2 n=1 Tax=Anneissia japonica TaxID=1529436 RepID=UPI001425778E|nr:serine/threonine-protein kinase SMG1-like isoform X2 [Anneissia japonica]